MSFLKAVAFVLIAIVCTTVIVGLVAAVAYIGWMVGLVCAVIFTIVVIYAWLNALWEDRKVRKQRAHAMASGRRYS